MGPTRTALVSTPFQNLTPRATRDDVMSVKKKRGSELTAKQSRFAAQDGIFTVQPPGSFDSGRRQFCGRPVPFHGQADRQRCAETRSGRHLADGMAFGYLLYTMPILSVEDGVLDGCRERIRVLSDRLLFARHSAIRDSLREQLQTEIEAARTVRNDPTRCPRCLESRGERTETTPDQAHHLYACNSCGQVWVVQQG